MAKKIAGTCYIKVDGDQLEVEGSVEVPLQDVIREGKMGINGFAGFKETAQQQYVKLSAFFTPDFPMDAVREGTDMTITVELANSKVYTLSNAVLVGETAINNDEGTVSLEFNGEKGIWA